MILLILQAVIVVTFLTISRFRYGMTRSWSAIYYRLKDDNIEELFFWIMTGISIPLIIASGLAVDSLQDIWGTISMSVAGTMIIFSALAGDARNNDITERNHVIGATGGMRMAGIGFALWGIWWIVLAMIIGSSVMFVKKFKNHTYYIELYVYILTLIGFLCKFGII